MGALVQKLEVGGEKEFDGGKRELEVRLASTGGEGG